MAEGSNWSVYFVEADGPVEPDHDEVAHDRPRKGGATRLSMIGREWKARDEVGHDWP
jgi:hypothetical protein